MNKREKQVISVEAQRELEAIDTVLSGGAVADEHATLAELALAVQAMRPRPSEEFVRALDTRAAHGFKRKHEHRAPVEGFSQHPRGASHERSRLHATLVHPAFALGVLVMVAAAVIVPLSMSGGGQPAVPTPVRGGSPVSPQETGAATGLQSRAGVGSTAKPAEGVTGGSAQSASGAAAPGARQVERTASLDIGVAPASIESTAHQVFALVSAFHGYVGQSSVSSGGPEQGGASFDLRLPSANLAGAIAALAHLGHVRSENGTTNDVTDQVNSLQRSLSDVEAERTSLLAQLAHTSDPRQAEALKARLQAVERSISQRQGALRALTNRITYTSVALSLTPEAPNGATAGDLTPGGAARDAAEILAVALAVLVLAAATLLPLVVVAVTGWIALTITRRRLREQTLDAS